MTASLLTVQETDTASPVQAGSSGKFAITIIKAGQGSSGYYPADVLERDGATTFPKGTHVYLDHPSEDDKYNRPERSVRDLAGVLSTDAKWDSNCQSLLGEMQIVPAYAGLVETLAPHVGMSIRALAYAENEEVPGVGMVNKVSKFVKGESVDIVTHAGAGGNIISMIESARNAVHPAKLVESPPKENKVEMTKEDFAKALNESNTALLAGLVEALKPKTAEVNPIDIALGFAKALNESGLTPAVQNLVAEAVKNGAKPSEAIEAHKAAFGSVPQTAQQAGPVKDAYQNMVETIELSHGFGTPNAGGNAGLIVGGGVVGVGESASSTGALTEAEKKDWESALGFLVTESRKNGVSL